MTSHVVTRVSLAFYLVLLLRPPVALALALSPRSLFTSL